MKTNITTLILSISVFFCIAQEDIVPLTQLSTYDRDIEKHYYFKDINNDLNKFLGTWQYQDVNKELIVTFYLKTHDVSGGSFRDGLYAKFKYTENGTVIYNTLNDTSSSSEHDIMGSSFKMENTGQFFGVNTNKMSLSYFEPTNVPYRYYSFQALYLEYLPCTGLGCSPQLKWDIFWVKSQDSDVWPFKIPKDLTLIKQ